MRDFNVRYEDDHTLITLDELTTLDEIKQLLNSQQDLVNKSDTIDHIVEAVGDYQWILTPEKKKTLVKTRCFQSLS